MSKNTVLAKILGESLDSLPPDFWLGYVTTGLSRNALSELATYLGLTEKNLLTEIGAQKAVGKKDVLLPQEVTEVVLRVTQLLSEAEVKLTPESAAKWLTSPQPALRGRVPLNLTQSGIGYEYVQTAISRF